MNISRIANWQDDNYALSYIYTENERASMLKAKHASEYFAAVFAVKEAFMKAIGTGWGDGVQWKDIEVRSENGGISVSLFHRAKELCGDRTVFVSADCTRTLAVALVVISDGT